MRAAIRTAMHILVIAAALLKAAPVSAQGPSAALPARITLEAVLRLLEERSPRTVAELAAIPVVAADRVTARTLPNPTLSYGSVHLVQGLSTGAVTQHQVVLEQPLLLF